MIRVRTPDKRWVLGLILFVLFFLKGERIRGEAIPLSEYRSRIQEAVEGLESGDGEIRQDDLAILEKRFPAGLIVQEMDDEGVRVDRKDLLRLFHEAGKSPEETRPLLVYLKALSQQLSREDHEITSRAKDWGESRRLLDEVYLAKEFKYLKEKKKSPWAAFIEKIRRFLREWLQDHLGTMGGRSGKWAEFLFYGVVLAVGIIVIVWILRSSSPLRWRLKRQPTVRPSSQSKSVEKSWAVWREEALSKAQNGEFRDAIRHLFISVLKEGHQKGWWVYEPESTNREHLARMEGPVERRETLQKLTDLYERAWYGLGRPGNEEFVKCEAWSRRMGAHP
jgi:hypothetical protein